MDHSGGNLKMQKMNVQLIASEDAHHTMATFTGRASDVVSGTVFAVTADWHQAGVGVAVHIRTGDDDCAKAKLEPRTSAISGTLENLFRKGFMWLSSKRHTKGHCAR